MHDPSTNDHDKNVSTSPNELEDISQEFIPKHDQDLSPRSSNGPFQDMLTPFDLMVTNTKGILKSTFDSSPLKDQEDTEKLPMPYEDIQEPFISSPSFKTNPCQEFDPKHVKSNYEINQDQ